MSDPQLPDNLSQLSSRLDVLLDVAPEQRANLIAELSLGDPVLRSELERLVADCEREPPLLDRPQPSASPHCWRTTADNSPRRWQTAIA